MVRGYIVEVVGGDGSLGDAVDYNVGDLVVGCRRDGECLAPTGADGHASLGRDRAIASCGCRDGIRRQCKRGADRMVRGYIVEVVGGDGSLGDAVDYNVGDLVVGCRRDGECLAATGADGHASLGRDRAIASCGCRDGIRRQCKRGADRVVGSHTAERIGGDGAFGDAVNYNVGDLVVGCRRDGECLVPTGADGYVSLGRDGAVASCGCCDGIRRQCKRGADRVVGSHTAERIGGDGAFGDAVDYHVGDLVVGCRRDGECLGSTGTDGYAPLGRDGAVASC